MNCSETESWEEVLPRSEEVLAKLKVCAKVGNTRQGTTMHFLQGAMSTMRCERSVINGETEGQKRVCFFLAGRVNIKQPLLSFSEVSQCFELRHIFLLSVPP